MRVYPVSIGYYSGGAGTLYYSTHGFKTGPADSPANTPFRAYVKQPATLRRDLFGPGTTFGRIQARYGELVLSNRNGRLDDLFDYAFDGRELVQYQGEAGSTYPGGYDVLVASTMEEAEFNEGEVRIKLRDRTALLDKPIQTTLYAGTGTLEGGTELKGKPRPMLYGYRRHIRLTLVNPALLIYQATNVGTLSISSGEVFEGGMSIPADGTPTYSDQTDLLTNAPTAGTYRYLPAGGYVRLGSSPTLVVTCHGTAGAQTIGSLFDTLMTQAGVTNTDSTVQATLDAIGGVVGLHIGTGARPTYAEVLDQLMNTCGAWWGGKQAGQLTARQLLDPATQDPTYTFTDANVDQLQRISVRDAFGGVPCWRLAMETDYKEPFTDGEIAGAATASDRAILYETTLATVGGTDTTIRDAHPLAPDIVLPSLWQDSAVQVSTEAARQFDLRSVKRDRLRFRCPMNEATLALDLGDYVRLEHSRYDLSGGKNFAIISLEPHPLTAMMSVEVWG